MITHQVVHIRKGQSAAFSILLKGLFKPVNYYQGRFAGVDKSFIFPAQSGRDYTTVKLLKDGPSLIGMVAEVVFSPVTVFESLVVF